jgi:hypothetical protein
LPQASSPFSFPAPVSPPPAPVATCSAVYLGHDHKSDDDDDSVQILKHTNNKTKGTRQHKLKTTNRPTQHKRNK